jgi:hypothetical protein
MKTSTELKTIIGRPHFFNVLLQHLIRIHRFSSTKPPQERATHSEHNAPDAPARHTVRK